MNHTTAAKTEPKGSAWISCILPYLMAIWFCLAILQGSPMNIPPILVLLKTIALSLFCVGVLHAIAYAIIRKSPTAELVVLVIVAFFGPMGSLANMVVPKIGTVGFFTLWLAIQVALGVLFMFARQKFINSLIPVVLFAIALTVGFQAIGIGMPVVNDYRHIEKLDNDLQRLDPVLGFKPQMEQNEKPDIYYIIVDAYARQDVLSEIYDFDNKPFVDELRKLGFFVGDASRSNYHLTELSLASSLNMTHLDGLNLEQFQTRAPIRKMISNSSVFRFLKRMGYETVSLETGKSDTECKNFDQHVRFGKGLDDYQDVLFHSSAGPSFVEMTGGMIRSAARRHGDRVVSALESVPNVVDDQSKPTFVFSHLLSPHPPYVFDAAGNEVDFHGHYLLADGGSFTECFDYDLEIYRETYRDQVQFINKKLLAMIDQIQSKDRESIIIIQGDHGPRLGFGNDPSTETGEQASVLDPNMRYREGFSILNAIYLAGKSNTPFYADMSPVNTFRLIFNDVFGANLDREPDESFFEDSYEFQNMTTQALPLKTSADWQTAITQNHN